MVYLCKKNNSMKSKVNLFLFALLITVGFNAVAAKKSLKTAAPVTQSSLSGIILDKSSNETLAGVTIQLANSDQKIYSNSKGEFSLDGIEPGTYKVKINCISYKEKEISVKITRTPNDRMKILLNPIEP